jgi:ribosomal protein S18 acetylase RimI-like enzyme
MCTTDSSPQPHIDPSTAHQLDNPIWNSLTTVHAQIAEAASLACRFPADVTALGALMEPSEEAWSALASLPSGPKVTVLVSDESVDPPAGWEILESVVGLQMIYADRNPPTPAPAAISKGLIELTATDAPEMLALAQLTRPGPFGIRARDLGTFLGIRREGKLVAMAGERLRLPGFTEISAVCTDPQHTSHGLGAALVVASLTRICGRGEVPFLHVREVNTRAIALYQRLGFVRRRAFQFVAVRPLAV